MSTIVNISPSSLFSIGSVSLSTTDNEPLASLLMASATTLSSGSISINVHAENLELTKSYVESLSDEQINTMLYLLDNSEIVNDVDARLVLKY